MIRLTDQSNHWNHSTIRGRCGLLYRAALLFPCSRPVVADKKLDSVPRYGVSVSDFETERKKTYDDWNLSQGSRGWGGDCTLLSQEGSSGKTISSVRFSKVHRICRADYQVCQESSGAWIRSQRRARSPGPCSLFPRNTTPYCKDL